MATALAEASASVEHKTKDEPYVESEQHSVSEKNQTSPEPSIDHPVKADANDRSAIPNGGFTAWMQVLGAWMLFFNTWGILNTFGVFQTYYESGHLFQTTSSNISWIGSIQSALLLLVSGVTGPIFDAGYFRYLLVIGSFGVVFGHMMLSLCTEYWQALLAQGFCVGLTAGCLLVPSVAIIPQYFDTRLGLTIGLAASGSSVGGILYPIAFYRMIDEIGFAWSVRVLGFIALATLTIPLAVMKMRVQPAAKRKLIDVTAFKDFDYMFFCIMALIGFIGLYVVLFYQSYLAESKHLTSTSMAFYLVAILNTGSVFGRTLPNILSDTIGPLNVMAPGAFIVAILAFCLIAVENAGGIITVVLLYGFFSGIFIALPTVIFVALTPDKSKLGARIGMGFAFIALGVLCGGPGGGGVLGTDDGDLHWTSTWVYAGVTSLAAGVGLTFLRMKRANWKLMVKV